MHYSLKAETKLEKLCKSVYVDLLSCRRPYLSLKASLRRVGFSPWCTVCRGGRVPSRGLGGGGVGALEKKICTLATVPPRLLFACAFYRLETASRGMLGPSQPLSNKFHSCSVDSPCQGLCFFFNIQISLFSHLGAVGVAKKFGFWTPYSCKRKQLNYFNPYFYIQTG